MFAIVRTMNNIIKSTAYYIQSLSCNVQSWNDLFASLSANQNIFKAQLTCMYSSHQLMWGGNKIPFNSCLKNKAGWSSLIFCETCFRDSSQAAIRAIDSTVIKNSTTLEATMALNTLGESNEITLRWIPAHCGYEGK